MKPKHKELVKILLIYTASAVALAVVYSLFLN